MNHYVHLNDMFVKIIHSHYLQNYLRCYRHVTINWFRDPAMVKKKVAVTWQPFILHFPFSFTEFSFSILSPFWFFLLYSVILAFLFNETSLVFRGQVKSLSRYPYKNFSVIVISVKTPRICRICGNKTKNLSNFNNFHVCGYKFHEYAIFAENS